MKEEGLRFNEGKNRMELLEPWAIEKLAEVFTFGANKYAEHNWLRGMRWSKITASLKRHLSAYEQGIDFDKESNLLHAQHIAWNAMALLSYYKHFPQGDDRLHNILPKKKIGLDIDDVLADWTGDWAKLNNIERPDSWNFDRNIVNKFNLLKSENKLESFYENLTVLTDPNDIPFEPSCYITSRPCSIETTMKWLDTNGFPHAPIYTVDVNTSKVDAAKKAGIDIFIDDKYEHFVELNQAGICTFLFDRKHNQDL